MRECVWGESCGVGWGGEGADSLSRFELNMRPEASSLIGWRVLVSHPALLKELPRLLALGAQQSAR